MKDDYTTNSPKENVLFDLRTEGVNPFTPKSDQCQISPAASAEILHPTVWRTQLFIAYSDVLSPPHLDKLSVNIWENVLFELGMKGLSEYANVDHFCPTLNVFKTMLSLSLDSCWLRWTDRQLYGIRGGVVMSVVSRESTHLALFNLSLCWSLPMYFWKHCPNWRAPRKPVWCDYFIAIFQVAQNPLKFGMLTPFLWKGDPACFFFAQAGKQGFKHALESPPPHTHTSRNPPPHTHTHFSQPPSHTHTHFSQPPPPTHTHTHFSQPPSHTHTPPSNSVKDTRTVFWLSRSGGWISCNFVHIFLHPWKKKSHRHFLTQKE